MFFAVKSCIFIFLFINLTFGKEGGATGKLEGQICALGDIDRDLNTDLILHKENFLKIYLQGENGEFFEARWSINIGSAQTIACAIGDFNGNSYPDILVSKKKPAFFSSDSGYEATVYMFDGKSFDRHDLVGTFLDELAVMDVNGDGISDLIGFYNNGSLFCRLGTGTANFITCEDFFGNFTSKPHKNSPKAFVDINGDLSAEIIFGVEDDGDFKLEAWKRLSNEKWVHDSTLISDFPTLSCKSKYYGAALYADFDADGFIDIGVPCCSDENCNKVELIMMWNQRVKQWQDYRISGLEGSELFSKKEDGNVVFRVGDFSLDGYPDLIGLVREKFQNPMIFENVPCVDCISNATRKFELKTTPRLIQPADVSLGQIQLASFFDLKEDGRLDVILEYIDADRKMAVDFIRCEDKGDTTFLKVQVFSSVCQYDCGPGLRIGSGIAWHGACVMFSMTGSWGSEQRGVQCQMPQTTNRALHTPFSLFGLGRSPNFVDYVHIGSPRYSRPSGFYHSGNQHYDLKQIVPNSRLIVIPPKANDSHWQSRLYLTPSQLIIQSLLVLVSVCAILLLLVAFLHFREKRADQHERQAQSHRFHFDAM